MFAGWALLCLWIGLLPHVVFVAVRETGERRFQEPRRASSARARVARGAAERCRPSPSRAHSIKSIGYLRYAYMLHNYIGGAHSSLSATSNMDAMHAKQKTHEERMLPLISHYY